MNPIMLPLNSPAAIGGLADALALMLCRAEGKGTRFSWPAYGDVAAGNVIIVRLTDGVKIVQDSLHETFTEQKAERLVEVLKERFRTYNGLMNPARKRKPRH